MKEDIAESNRPSGGFSSPKKSNKNFDTDARDSKMSRKQREIFNK